MQGSKAIRPLTGSGTEPGARAYAGVAFTLAAVAVWSTNALGADLALARHDVGSVLVAISAAAVAALLVLRRVDRAPAPALSGRDRGFGLVVGVVGVGGTVLLQYVGFAAGPLVATNVISYGWPMFAALALAVVLRTRRAATGLGFALLGFAGVAVMFSDSDSATAGGQGPLGYLAALGSALCMACYTLAVPRVRLPAVDVLLAGAVTVLVVAAAYLAVSGTALPPGPGLLAAVYCGAGPLAGGYLLWSRGMVASSGRLAPLGYVIPLLSTGLLLALGRPLTPRAAVGAVLVLVCTVGVLVVERRGSELSEEAV